MAAWWSGSYEGATDVVIKAARLPPEADAWEPATTVANVPDRFQGNPVLYALPDGRLWLFFVVAYERGPTGIQIMFRESADYGHSWTPLETFCTRRGIRTRNHPITTASGKVLLPLHDHGAGSSVFLLSDDLGQTWHWGGSVRTEPGNAQPTVVRRANGELYALMRTWNEDPNKRTLWQSESSDGGYTWSQATYSRVPTVSSAIEMVGLTNGHVVLAYNDGQGRERTPLTLALSVDGGRTWANRRNLETGEGPFSYPSIIQARDGRLHVTYSYRRLYIRHVELDEAWILEGDG
jgi:predicted neuraminidase